MMSEDRGDPIMRRLTEFSEIISTKLSSPEIFPQK
jgi:hypothetical protein